MYTAQNKEKSYAKQTRGFSIIELIVAISILVVLSSVLLFNYNTMNSRITLDTLAQETAQWMRETQVSAMSARHTADLTLFPGYGLRFERTKPDQFIFFADFDRDKHYTFIAGDCGAAGVECQKIIKLPRGTKIEKLCGETSPPSPSGDCVTSTPVDDLDVVFSRPDPDAVINANQGGSPPLTLSRARVTLVSVTGYKRTVEVWTTGQVSVQ